MRLPGDVALCNNAECPIALHCARYLSPAVHEWQAHQLFQPVGDRCESFIEIEEEENANQ